MTALPADDQRIAGEIESLLHNSYDTVVEEDARGLRSLYRVEIEAETDDGYDATYTLLLVPPEHASAAIDAVRAAIDPIG